MPDALKEDYSCFCRWDLISAGVFGPLVKRRSTRGICEPLVKRYGEPVITFQRHEAVPARRIKGKTAKHEQDKGARTALDSNVRLARGTSKRYFCYP